MSIQLIVMFMVIQFINAGTTMTQKVTLTYEEIGEHEHRGMEVSDHRVTHEIISDGVDWNTMLQHYINFLRGIGYSIPDEDDLV